MTSSFQPTTGLRDLDKVLSGVSPGDNIVWQIEALENYEALVRPYAAAALAAQRRLIYFRFADHPPLLDGVETHHPDARSLSAAVAQSGSPATALRSAWTP